MGTFKASDAKVLLEPLIVSPELPDDSIVMVTELHAALSIAVSLKRIADVLTGAEIPSALHFGLQDLAYAAGLSFKQGMNIG